MYSKEYGIDDSLVYSVIKVESKFNKKAVSKRNAKGLMQISEITQNWAQEELGLENIDIFDFEISKDDMEKIDSINNDERMKPQAYENLYKVTKKEIV